ncbi:Integrase, catalytic core [Cucumis melo var. makuwa]|uniref:Integrase, catalytic core n=1 Tax=Cucumis melo var. makuwa TaxID=1194695 RepID=A0A5D3D641_CUCMM|nr:Integrase, catalytic core [Cucumis melo var. makuwa]TYK19028.1 Integrase, catalytic core [Cucumis melo var. makuwa]
MRFISSTTRLLSSSRPSTLMITMGHDVALSPWHCEPRANSVSSMTFLMSTITADALIGDVATTLLKQEGMSVLTYFTQLNSLWDELSSIIPFSLCVCGNEKCITEQQNQDHAIEFL